MLKYPKIVTPCLHTKAVVPLQVVPQALLRVESDDASFAGEGVGPQLGVIGVGGGMNLLLVLRQLAEGGEGLVAHLHHLVAAPNGLFST